MLHCPFLRPSTELHMLYNDGFAVLPIDFCRSQFRANGLSSEQMAVFTLAFIKKFLQLG